MAVRVSDKSVLLGGTALVAGCFFLTFHRTLLGLFRAWSYGDDHSHGFLVVPVCLYLLWRKREALHEAAIRPAATGLLIAVLSLISYLVGVWGGIATLSSLAMLATLCGIVIFFLGYRVARIMAFPLLFLLFMIPVPSQIYASLTVPLQLLVTRMSGYLLDLAGMPVHVEGNFVQLPGIHLQVVNACSGLRSMTSILMLSAFFGYLLLTTHWGKVCLFLSGVPISIFVNVIRIVSLAAASHFFALGTDKEPFHTLWGLGVFVLALGCLLFVKQVIAWIERLSSSA
jgi:exosortase